MDILNAKKFYMKYLAFYLSSVVVHIILISIITFFHFLLDHRLIVVENWVYDFSWQLFLLSKITTFIIFFKYFVFSNTRDKLFDISLFEFNLKDPKNYFLPVLALGFIIYYLDPFVQDHHSFDIGRGVFHFLSISLTMIIDLVIVSILFNESKRKRLHFVEVCIFSIVSYGAFQGIFLFSTSSPYVLVLNFLMFYFFYKKNECLSIFFIFLFIVPLYLFLGFDPIWSSDFSLLSTNLNSINIHILAMALSIILYFNWGHLKRRVS